MTRLTPAQVRATLGRVDAFLAPVRLAGTRLPPNEVRAVRQACEQLGRMALTASPPVREEVRIALFRLAGAIGDDLSRERLHEVRRWIRQALDLAALPSLRWPVEDAA